MEINSEGVCINVREKVEQHQAEGKQDGNMTYKQVAMEKEKKEKRRKSSAACRSVLA